MKHAPFRAMSSRNSLCGNDSIGCRPEDAGQDASSEPHQTSSTNPIHTVNDGEESTSAVPLNHNCWVVSSMQPHSTTCRCRTQEGERTEHADNHVTTNGTLRDCQVDSDGDAADTVQFADHPHQRNNQSDGVWHRPVIEEGSGRSQPPHDINILNPLDPCNDHDVLVCNRQMRESDDSHTNRHDDMEYYFASNNHALGENSPVHDSTEHWSIPLAGQTNHLFNAYDEFHQTRERLTDIADDPNSDAVDEGYEYDFTHRSRPKVMAWESPCEDHGDFIETDIPRKPYELASSTSSSRSSLEDLHNPPNLPFVWAGSNCDNKSVSFGRAKCSGGAGIPGLYLSDSSDQGLPREESLPRSCDSSNAIYRSQNQSGGSHMIDPDGTNSTIDSVMSGASSSTLSANIAAFNETSSNHALSSSSNQNNLASTSTFRPVTQTGSPSCNHPLSSATSSQVAHPVSHVLSAPVGALNMSRMPATTASNSAHVTSSSVSSSGVRTSSVSLPSSHSSDQSIVFGGDSSPENNASGFGAFSAVSSSAQISESSNHHSAPLLMTHCSGRVRPRRGRCHSDPLNAKNGSRRISLVELENLAWTLYLMHSKGNSDVSRNCDVNRSDGHGRPRLYERSGSVPESRCLALNIDQHDSRDKAGNKSATFPFTWRSRGYDMSAHQNSDRWKDEEDDIAAWRNNRCTTWGDERFHSTSGHFPRMRSDVMICPFCQNSSADKPNGSHECDRLLSADNRRDLSATGNLLSTISISNSHVTSSLNISGVKEAADNGSELNISSLPRSHSAPAEQSLVQLTENLNFDSSGRQDVAGESSKSKGKNNGMHNGMIEEMVTFFKNAKSVEERDSLRLNIFNLLINNWLTSQLEQQYGPVDDTGLSEKVMVWSEYLAYCTQVENVGRSACGPTAVLNVLRVFGIEPGVEEVCDVIHTNLRLEEAPVTEYILSRSVAGTTAEQLIEGIRTLSGGEVYGRFFHFYPNREVDIAQWLAHWIRKGAVPLVTLNLQRGVPVGTAIPDAWHHQMVHGVGPKGVYLTNPQMLSPMRALRDQLCSEGMLLIRREDVLSRWTEDSQLSILLQQEDPAWRQLNVLGQVVNVLREEDIKKRMPRVMGLRPQLTSHVRIPAWYKSGITLFVKKDSEVYRELLNEPELSLD